MHKDIIFNCPITRVNITDVIAFDTEFNDLDTKHAKLIAFSITNTEGQTYAFDCGLYQEEELHYLFTKIQSCKVVICHNSKVEIGVIYSNIGVLLMNCWCTMLASQIIDNGYGYQVSKDDAIKGGFEPPEDYKNGKVYYTKNMVGGIPYMQTPHGLVGCLKRYLNVDLIGLNAKKLMQRSFIEYDFKKPLTKEQLIYAAEDTKYLLDLRDAEIKHAKERELMNIVSLENNLTPVLVKMEQRGCKIDIELHKSNIIKWQAEHDKIVNQLDEMMIALEDKHPGITKFNFDRNIVTTTQGGLFGEHSQILVSQECFNYSSTKQLRELFEACEQECPVDDSKKISFSEESIKFYVTNNPDSKFSDFLDLILKLREYEKLLGTYGQKLIDSLDGDRIRTNYSQCWAETGRLTSSEIKKGLGINLANIPKNPDIRKTFIPDEDYVFIDSDMTGQELIIAGDFAKEPVLLKAFQEGFDHHSFLASISYGIIIGQPIEIKNESIKLDLKNKTYDVKKMRDDHKACLFSKIYLGGPKRIQAILNKYLVDFVPAKERFNRCKQISEALDEKLGTLMGFLKSKVEETKENGYTVANKLGRRRYFDEPDRVYGDAANMPIQGTGADAMKIAMINLDKFFVQKAKELQVEETEVGYLSLSIYDQVLINLNKKYLYLKDEIPKIMGESLTYFLTTLKGSSDLNVREFWGK